MPPPVQPPGRGRLGVRSGLNHAAPRPAQSPFQGVLMAEGRGGKDSTPVLPLCRPTVGPVATCLYNCNDLDIITGFFIVVNS